jgi:hypothetical protein
VLDTKSPILGTYVTKSLPALDGVGRDVSREGRQVCGFAAIVYVVIIHTFGEVGTCERLSTTSKTVISHGWELEITYQSYAVAAATAALVGPHTFTASLSSWTCSPSGSDKWSASLLSNHKNN